MSLGVKETARVPLSRPAISSLEFEYVRQALESRQLAGDGPFTARVVRALERSLPSGRVLLVHSCTAALEMAALLAGIEAGDEVIMPSFTFVSTANAFALRGAVPVFVDVHASTMNIDERCLEAAVTDKTRAIVPVHYAGISCAMDEIMHLAKKLGLLVIEDAAQAFDSTYKGKAVGTSGDMSAFSFHETKNITAGEGGALLVNNPEFFARASVIRDKGTNRANFNLGLVDKYSWVDIGSSYTPSELNAALLLGQLERSAEIKAARARIWRAYYDGLESLELRGMVRRPAIPRDCETNFHLFTLVFDSAEMRSRALASLRSAGFDASFHYVPLHSSPAGRRLGRASGTLKVTDQIAACLLRLPLFPDLEISCVDSILRILVSL